MVVGRSKVAGMSIWMAKKAYPCTWGKSGVSYYCMHDCVFLKIVPIESRGYPVAVVQYAEKPKDTSVLLSYKKPESIPEGYFARVGKTKTIK
jgi:hypothetical protein